MKAQQRRGTIKPVLETVFWHLCRSCVSKEARLGEESIVAGPLQSPGKKFQGPKLRYLC